MEPMSPQGVLLRENEHKRFVKVRADHGLDGKTRPIKLRTEDGPELVIDAVTDIRQAAATKAGGQGIRYTCRIGGHEIYLFHDRDMWFVELQGREGEEIVRALSHRC